MSEDAEMANKPELEIFADDVICAHGATSGQIDEDLLFYLRARGIPEAEAKTLLVLAFLSEAIEEYDEEDVTEGLEARVREAGSPGTRLALGPIASGHKEQRRMTVATARKHVQTAGYDVEAIRRDFPILSREVYGKPLVYLDNGASAQKPKAVIDAVTKAYSEEYANVHRGLHFLSNTATDNYEAAREKVRRFLNAKSVDEVVFTKSTTEAINLVSYGLGPDFFGEGDEIVLSIMEHHSNIVPWHFHRERHGSVLKWVYVKEDGTFDLDAFVDALSDRTKLVAITHMSNVLGTVVPIKEICEIAHERGIQVLVDGSQAAVHMPVDVQDLGCDYYVFTGHKVYGPSGIGVLVGQTGTAERIAPVQRRRRDDPGCDGRRDHLQ